MAAHMSMAQSLATSKITRLPTLLVMSTMVAVLLFVFPPCTQDSLLRWQVHHRLHCVIASLLAVFHAVRRIDHLDAQARTQAFRCVFETVTPTMSRQISAPHCNGCPVRVQKPYPPFNSIFKPPDAAHL